MIAPHRQRRARPPPRPAPLRLRDALTRELDILGRLATGGLGGKNTPVALHRHQRRTRHTDARARNLRPPSAAGWFFDRGRPAAPSLRLWPRRRSPEQRRAALPVIGARCHGPRNPRRSRSRGREAFAHDRPESIYAACSTWPRHRRVRHRPSAGAPLERCRTGPSSRPCHDQKSETAAVKALGARGVDPDCRAVPLRPFERPATLAGHGAESADRRGRSRTRPAAAPVCRISASPRWSSTPRSPARSRRGRRPRRPGDRDHPRSKSSAVNRNFCNEAAKRPSRGAAAP